MSEFPSFLDSQSGIANCGGLKDLYKRALLRFHADLVARSLPSEAPEADEEWRRWIHSIKSTSALLGAKELNDIVREVEGFWRQNQEAPESTWEKMVKVYTQLRLDLDAWHESIG